MSRDASSHDPRDPGDARSTGRVLPSHETLGSPRRKSLATALAPKFANNTPPTANAVIRRAPITSVIAPISSAIPRSTP